MIRLKWIELHLENSRNDLTCLAYAPKAATKPSITPKPLNFSASGDMFVFVICIKYKEQIDALEFLLTQSDY